jgi:outer membrane protein assembly factor BamB
MTQDFNPNQSADKQLQAGSTLMNRYAIEEVIGIGGMGAVYRARDMHFPNAVKLVAVKEMIIQTRDPLVRKTIVQNFEREANILVTLEHPCIPRIFDYFSLNERSYLVLELIQGKDLEELLSQNPNPLPEEQVIQWAIELCDVLNYLHNHKPEPIIFRDMKPSNIMINQNNHVVLIDFGIAKSFKGGQKGTMIGTEGYSPPEQYRGEATLQADIYALGATLHHALTRKDPRLEPPFTFGDRPIRKINPVVSLEMETVVNTALQYNPADRFPSAEAMKDALLMAGRKSGMLARMPVMPSVSTDDAVKPIWKFQCEDEIRGTAAIDQGVVYVGAYDNNLYAVDATNGSFIWKYPTEGGIVTRPVVADGIVYFGSEDKRLYALSTRTGKISWSYAAEAPIRSSPVVAEGQVFFGADDGFMYAVNSTSTRLFWRYNTGSGTVRSSPVFANDQLYFGTEAGDFFCLTLVGQVKWRSKAKRAVLSSPAVSRNTLFFTSLDSILYALDLKSGYPVWRFRMGKGSVSSPCIADNYVITGCADGFIYCVEGASSREIWRYRAEHQVSGSPVVYKDSVYIGAADGTLYCLEYRTGRLRWKFVADGAITSSPIVYNDVLYVGSADHYLYALAV